MAELFELIASKPLEFLAGLGISTTTIYAIYSVLKGLIGLITKKSKKAKALLEQTQIASTTVNTLFNFFGGADKFLESIGYTVINFLSPVLEEFRTLLNKIANSDSCSIEQKAYIQSILAQTGNEQLALMYEQLKCDLLNKARNLTAETINTGTVEVQNTDTVAIDTNVQANTNLVEETINTVVETAKEIKTKAKKVKEIIKDITYA